MSVRPENQNSDGRLSLPEFASPADWRFDRIDRNLDGRVSRQEAARLFDRPVGEALPDETGECFYVDRQIVRVKDEVAEAFKKRGYPKVDCRWRPDTTELAAGYDRVGKNQKVLTAALREPNTFLAEDMDDVLAILQTFQK